MRRIETPTSSKVAAIGACGLCTVTRTPRTCAKRCSSACATAPAAASTNRSRRARDAAPAGLRRGLTCPARGLAGRARVVSNTFGAEQ